MILPERVLGDRADLLADVVGQLLVAVLARGVLAQDDVGHHGLAGVGVGGADHSGLGDVGVGDQGRLDLGGGEPVSGDVHHVVDPAEHPDVAVLVLLRAVTGEVVASSVVGVGEARPVGVDVALVVAPDGAQHRGPRLGEDQVAARAVRHRVAGVVDHVGPDPGQGGHRGARLAGGHARQWADHDRAGLGLPPGVDHRGAVLADHMPVPDVGLRVDRLPDRTEDAQRRHVVLVRDLVALLHERADRGRGGVEDRHLLLGDDLPPAAPLREVRGALVEDLGRPVGQRAVDDVGVPGHPADVRGAPVDVGLRLEVEDRPVGVGGLGEVAAGGVQDALRLAGGAGGVHHVERVLGVERLRRVLGGGGADRVVPPHVHVLVPPHVLAGTTDHQHLLHRVTGVGGDLAGLVDGRLQGRRSAAPVAAVGGDHHLGLAVLDPGGERLGREAAEHDRVRRADAGAGEHRHDRLGDHRHVDRDPVAGGHAQRGQRVGGLRYLVLELGVGDVALVADRLPHPVDRHPVTEAVLDVPVHAVVRRVQLAADEPLGERRLVPVQDAVPGLRPGQPLRRLGPVGLAVGRGLGVRVGLHVGARGQVRGRLEPAVFVQQVRQGLFAHV
jgi:hypothetical protein